MLALLLPLSILAQEPAACSFDTAAHIRLDTVILGLAPVRDASGEKRADYLAAAGAIREQFNRPGALRLPFAARVVERKSKEPRSSFAPFGLHGFVRFQLDSMGKLTNDPIVVSSSSPDIVESVITAIQRADSAYAFPPPSKSVRRDSGEIMLRFVDTARTKDPSVALLRLVIPAVIAQEGASVRDFKPPNYPDYLIRSRMTSTIPDGVVRTISDRVLLEFIIGTDSLVEPGSLQILDTPHRDLATRALQSLSTAHFRPAKIGGCVIPALVRFPVEFKAATVSVPVR